MLNCGIDFGSTYTTVSVYREDTQLLEAVQLNQDSPYIPSVAAFNGKKLEFGRTAKIHTGKKGVEIFKAFKMLLTETDPEVLKARGFTEEYTPALIAREFLTDLIHKVLARYGEEMVDQLVIGAPEIWFEEVKTIAGRSILRDLCKEIPEVKEVQVVSEPAAASAFFAYNYQRNTGTAFEGNILLIDYGGGTLDISLTQVSAEKEKDGQQYMEIKVLESNGAGENVDRRIGKAGIVYMETVMEEAIRRAGLLEEKEEIRLDSKFFQAVNTLEDELQNRTDEINEMFQDCGIDDLEELDEEFTEVPFRGEDVVVTYALLVEVYDKVIRKVFAAKLNEMIDFMKSHKIDYMDHEQDHFKIALVGGFGNFYLVNKQVMDTFKFISRDRRQQDIIKNKADCEKSISLGTALLASRVVGIRQTAPYSIGIFMRDQEGKPCHNYAFRYKMDIDYNEAYFPVGAKDGKPVVTFIANNAISQFVINMGHDDRTALVVPLKDEFREKLEGVVKNPYHTAVVGFSLDSSEVLSIHIREYDLFNSQVSKEDHEIELNKFGELFELTKVQKVQDA